MKKKMSAAAALLAAAMILAGCNGSGNTQQTTAPADTSAPAVTDAPDTAASTSSASSSSASTANPSAQEIADMIFPGSIDTYPVWSTIDRDKVVASIPDSAEDAERFSVTFGEFYREYMYYLVSNSIIDDMSSSAKENAESYRSSIINYLTFEKMFLYVAEKDYGIKVSDLTEEQLATIRENTDTVIQETKTKFEDTITAKLNSDTTVEEARVICDEVFDLLLAKCGISEDIFYEWETNNFIKDLLADEITKNASAKDEDVEEMFQTFYDQTVTLVTESPADYESNQAYIKAYIPEGTRTAKHIIVKFDESALNDIAEARNENKSGEAKLLIEKAYTDVIRKRVQEISDRIAGGANFDTLMRQYNEDDEQEYVVLTNSENFFPEYVSTLYSLKNKGDISDPVVCDNGVYFIQYVDDAKVTEEDINELKDSMREYLTDIEKNRLQSEAYADWTERFPYEIDSELLKLPEEEEEGTEILTGEE